MAPPRKITPPTPPEPQPGVPRLLSRRTAVLLGLFIVLGFGLLIGRLYWLQITMGDEYQAEAAAQQTLDATLPAQRGNIYDATGNVLARSVTVWDITADPTVCDPEGIAEASEGLAETLNLDADEVYEKLSDTSTRYKVLAKSVDKPTADAVKAFVNDFDKDLAVITTQTSVRQYPCGAFLASVLGFCNADGDGFYGLEKYYDETLAGVDGRTVTVRNRWGYEVDNDQATTYPAEDGKSLVLTVDINIQSILERYLSEAIDTYDVQERGVAIAIDVNTGAVLGMASKPDFDPNDPYTIYDEDLAATLDGLSGDEFTTAQGAARERQWKNKAITELYEPGSVFKLVTAAAALDAGVIVPNSSFNCPGSYAVADRTYTCYNHKAHGIQAVGQAVNNSCNIAFIQIAQRLGAEDFYEYYNGFGFREKTGIDLPGEESGISHTLSSLGPVQLASSSFGQTHKVTPIQMITAVCAVVNGGYLVQPHLVSSILDSNGNLVEEIDPEPKRQVVSEEVSSQVVSMMEGVVDGGSGRNAYVAGYRIGGKSGTSEKLDVDANEDGSYNVSYSFVGVMPVDDPQIAVLVMLDDVRSDTFETSGTISAPLVGNMLSEIGPYMGFEKDASNLSSTVTVPNLVLGNSSSEWILAQSTLNSKGLDHELVDGIGQVIHQSPAAGTKVPLGSTVYLYTQSTEDQTAAVPDVVGRQGEFASQMLKAAGFNVSVSGPENGLVTAQSVEKDSQQPLGTVITITTTDSGAGEE